MKQRAPSGHVCGESHHKARVPFSIVQEMRDLYRSWKAAGSNKGYSEIGYLYGISTWTARDICDYRTRVNG